MTVNAEEQGAVAGAEKGTAAGTAAAPKDQANGRRLSSIGSNLEPVALILVMIVVIAAFSIAKPHTYWALGNLQTILGSQALALVLALALIVPLLAGDYDLSIASTMTFSSMVVAVLNVQHHMNIGLAVLIALALCLVIGIVNAVMAVVLHIDSFIATLGTQTVLLGVVQWMSGDNTVTGTAQSLTNWTISNRFLGVSVMFYYGLGITLLMWLVLEYTPVGRRLLFVGRGQSVARLSGLRVGRIRSWAFIVSALGGGIGGVLYAGSYSSADPTSGASYLLPAFAAAFLGATTISPGRFNPWGTFIAVYFLISGVTGLQLLGADTYVQNLFYGGALVIAVALSILVKRRTASSRV
jgi:ribose transport system permease protein